MESVLNMITVVQNALNMIRTYLYWLGASAFISNLGRWKMDNLLAPTIQQQVPMQLLHQPKMLMAPAKARQSPAHALKLKCEDHRTRWSQWTCWSLKCVLKSKAHIEFWSAYQRSKHVWKSEAQIEAQSANWRRKHSLTLSISVWPLYSNQLQKKMLTFVTSFVAKLNIFVEFLDWTGHRTTKKSVDWCCQGQKKFEKKFDLIYPWII